MINSNQNIVLMLFWAGHYKFAFEGNVLWHFQWLMPRVCVWDIVTWFCMFKGAARCGIVLRAPGGTETFTFRYCCTCFELPRCNCCCLKYVITRVGFCNFLGCHSNVTEDSGHQVVTHCFVEWFLMSLWIVGNYLSSSATSQTQEIVILSLIQLI